MSLVKILGWRSWWVVLSILVYGALVVQLQDALDDRDLSVATHILHAMTPDDLTVLEQELAANLEQVAALELGGTLCLGHVGPLF